MPPDSLRLIYQILIFSILFSVEWRRPFYPNRHNRLRHSAVNIVLGIINGLAGVLLLNGALIVMIDLTRDQGWGLLNALALPRAVEFCLAFILFDAWMYAWHRLNHKVPVLWRFHSVHHSDREMDVTTAFRFHVLEIVFSVLARLFLIAFLGLSFWMLFIYELALQLVVLFHHSNIGLSEKQDKFLRGVIVSPNMHRVHHSDVPTETDSNFSSILSLWDRLFQTYIEKKPTTICFGLKQVAARESQSLLKLLREPFK